MEPLANLSQLVLSAIGHLADCDLPLSACLVLLSKEDFRLVLRICMRICDMLLAQLKIYSNLPNRDPRLNSFWSQLMSRLDGSLNTSELHTFISDLLFFLNSSNCTDVHDVIDAIGAGKKNIPLDLSNIYRLSQLDMVTGRLLEARQVYSCPR